MGSDMCMFRLLAVCSLLADCSVHSETVQCQCYVI